MGFLLGSGPSSAAGGLAGVAAGPLKVHYEAERRGGCRPDVTGAKLTANQPAGGQ